MKARYYILCTLVVVIIVVRIVTSPLLLYYLNNQLSQPQGYVGGHISDLDISILRGSINLKKVKIIAKNYPDQIPVFIADSIKIVIHFHALFTKKLVIDVQINKPVFNYIINSSFSNTANPSLIIKLRNLKITNGEINILNLKDNPTFKIFINDINGTFNQSANSKIYQINIDAKVMDSGDFMLQGKWIPFENGGDFYIKSSIKSLDITTFNQILKHYTDISVSKGEFSIFGEISARGNVISGYAKPFIKNLVITEKSKDNVAQKIYKKTIELGAKILENPKHDTVATKIKIQGNIKDPNISNFSVISYLAQHAFIQALIPEIDHQFSFQDIDYNVQDNGKNPRYRP